MKWFHDGLSFIFLIAARDKDRCDGSFDLVNRKLQHNDGIVVSDMFCNVKEKIFSKIAICGAKVP